MSSTILVITTVGIEVKKEQELKALGIDRVHWVDAESIRPSNYEVVILDTRIPDNILRSLTTDQGQLSRHPFLRMRSDIEILLEAGGVVLVLAGQSRSIRGLVEETNYDFLPEEFLEQTHLSTSESRAGPSYEGRKEWDSYFSNAPTYFKTVYVENDEKRGLSLSYLDPHDGAQKVERVLPLAWMKVTSQLVGCLVPWKQGVIGVLPPPKDIYGVLPFLKNKGTELYKENLERFREIAEIPSWIENHKCPEHKRLEGEANRLTGELKTVEERLKPFIVASSSLYSIQRRLEIATTKIFLDFDWEVKDQTHTEEPIDYIITRRSETAKSLVVALTGTTGYIDSKSGKLAQLLGAFPEVGDNGRLVFLVNGSVEIDPSARTVSNYITSEALKRLTKNDVCVLPIYDLYRQWVDYLDKKITSDQIFESIHGTCGLFKYTPH